MKNKKLFIALALVIVGALSLMGFVSANKANDFIIVRTFQGAAVSNMTKTMIISKSDGTSERVSLKSIEIGASSAEDNLNVEVEKIKEILDSGYELKSFSGGGGGDHLGFGMVYTYLFVKK